MLGDEELTERSTTAVLQVSGKRRIQSDAPLLTFDAAGCEFKSAQNPYRRMAGIQVAVIGKRVASSYRRNAQARAPRIKGGAVTVYV